MVRIVCLPHQDLKDWRWTDHLNCCLCALERAYREGKSKFKKPISCALYPIRAKDFGNEVYGINYNKWRICKDAIKKGEELNLPVYKFLEGPLIEKFGKEWYDEASRSGRAVACRLGRLIKKRDFEKLGNLFRNLESFNIHDITFLESSFPGKSVYLLLAEFKSAECLLIQFSVADVQEIIDL